MGAFAPGPDQVGVRRRVGEEGCPVCQLAGLFADQLAELEGRGGLVGGEGREERRGFVDPADFEAPAGAGQRFGVAEAGQGRGEDLLRAGRMGGHLAAGPAQHGGGVRGAARFLPGRKGGEGSGKEAGLRELVQQHEPRFRVFGVADQPGDEAFLELVQRLVRPLGHQQAHQTDFEFVGQRLLLFLEQPGRVAREVFAQHPVNEGGDENGRRLVGFRQLRPGDHHEPGRGTPADDLPREAAVVRSEILAGQQRTGDLRAARVAEGIGRAQQHRDRFLAGGIAG